MQAPKSNFNQLGSNLNPLKDATGVAAIDYSANIDNLIGKLDKLTTWYDTGHMDKDVIKYINIYLEWRPKVTKVRLTMSILKEGMLHPHILTCNNLNLI